MEPSQHATTPAACLRCWPSSMRAPTSTRGLTEDAATDQRTLDYVQAVECTVRFYGEDEEVMVERLAEEGRDVPGRLRRPGTGGDRLESHPSRRTAGGASTRPKARCGRTIRWPCLELGQAAASLRSPRTSVSPTGPLPTFSRARRRRSTLLDSGYRPGRPEHALDSPGQPLRRHRRRGLAPAADDAADAHARGGGRGARRLGTTPSALPTFTWWSTPAAAWKARSSTGHGALEAFVSARSGANVTGWVCRVRQRGEEPYAAAPAGRPDRASI